jgi:hypothetical protein
MHNDAYLARLAQRAYADHSFTADGDTQCLVEIDDRGVYRAVVAFRGTECDFEDILRDLRAVPWWDWQLGPCHAGFLKGARAMWPLIVDTVMAQGLEVALTGHSLGGALAAITGALMAANGKRPAALVTFGAPRPGFAELATWLKDVPQRRYVHGSDCVPSHPWPIWGYRHPGPATHLRHPGTRDDRFLDHRVAQYVTALDRLPAT